MFDFAKKIVHSLTKRKQHIFTKSANMKRTIHSLNKFASGLQPPIKRRKVDTSSTRTKSIKRKYGTRVIGAMDIKSQSQDYCIEIKEDNLYLQYFPNFYSSQQAKVIKDKLEQSVEYDNAEDSSVMVFGKKHKIARKQTAIGDEGTSYKFSGNDVPSKPWSELPLIKEIKNKIQQQLSTTENDDDDNKNEENKEDVGSIFNFCLINRYNDGKDKVGFHKDDERDLVDNSSIVGVSFGATRDIIFKHQDLVSNSKKNKHNDNEDNSNQIKTVKISLKNGSLIVMRHPTNSFWYHSIPKRANINRVRISLTYRNMIPRKK